MSAGPASLTTKKLALAKKYNRTDAGQAEYLADHFDLTGFVYDCPRERWMHWSAIEATWLADQSAVDAIWLIAIEAARQRFQEAPQRYRNLDDRKAEAGFALRAEKVDLIERTLKQLSKLPSVRYAGEWDDRPELVGTPGGKVIEIGPSGSVLRAAEPDDHVARRTGVTADPTMATPHIDQFLLDIMGNDPTLVAALVRAIGYSLTGSLKHQHFWLLYGTGSNGKSVLLRLLLEMAADYGYNTPFSTFEKQHYSNTQTNDAAHLYGRRFVMASETGASSTLSEERLKAWSGGDPVTCRFLYSRKQFTYDSQMHIWLAVNHKPTVVDDSHGFWRRAIVIPFVVTFGSSGAKPADPDLLAKLQPELPGFLWKVCVAAAEVVADGLETPAQWLLATLNYREENDDLGTFIQEACDTSDPAARVQPGALYAVYLEWCADEGIRFKDRLTAKAFSIQLKERGHAGGRSNGKRYLSGIAVKSEGDLIRAADSYLRGGPGGSDLMALP